jgi:phenol/toluene 2-monooxygenase (NADH) P1/A1
MSIDIKSKSTETIRNTFSHIIRRLGDKPATRYQEGTYDIQSTHNIHYRPTWQPEKKLYDESRTAIKMDDWYKFLDPRQYYYGTYVMNRAKLQETADQNFNFVEKKGLLPLMPDVVKERVLQVILPLRHFEWAANMNNTQICAMGEGTAITAPAMYQAGDRLGIAQYITRIGLLIGENEVSVLDQAKQDWLEKEEWQGLRKAVEDSFVLKDWFELFVAQNFVMDGLIHPFFFDRYEQRLNVNGGTAQGMLTEFMSAWYADSTRWVDAQLKVAAAESEENAKLLADWINKWLADTEAAVLPLAKIASRSGEEILAEVKADLLKRAEKCGIKL